MILSQYTPDAKPGDIFRVPYQPIEIVLDRTITPYGTYLCVSTLSGKRTKLFLEA